MNIYFILSLLRKPEGIERVASQLANELSVKHNLTLVSEDDDSVTLVFKQVIRLL